MAVGLPRHLLATNTRDPLGGEGSNWLTCKHAHCLNWLPILSNSSYHLLLIVSLVVILALSSKNLESLVVRKLGVEAIHILL